MSRKLILPDSPSKFRSISCNVPVMDENRETWLCWCNARAITQRNTKNRTRTGGRSLTTDTRMLRAVDTAGVLVRSTSFGRGYALRGRPAMYARWSLTASRGILSISRSAATKTDGYYNTYRPKKIFLFFESPRACAFPAAA